MKARANTKDCTGYTGGGDSKIRVQFPLNSSSYLYVPNSGYIGYRTSSATRLSGTFYTEAWDPDLQESRYVKYNGTLYTGYVASMLLFTDESGTDRTLNASANIYPYGGGNVTPIEETKTFLIKTES